MSKAGKGAIEPDTVPPEQLHTNGTSKKHRSKKSKSTVAEEEPHVEVLRRKYMETADKSLIVPEAERVTLAWKDISYVIGGEANKGCCERKPKPEKRILNNVSGVVSPGRLVGIIGPSGAGKTSLLSILARLIKGKQVTGEIMINGEPATGAMFRQFAGFVAQEDIVMGSMTPFEVLNFASKLKSPELSDEQRTEKVKTLLRSMGLEHVQHSIIGYTGAASRNSGIKRGLSGGERKRVSICVELVNDPKLLLLDEPTSGLDSFAAKSVMESLRHLSFMGRTIVATIHQPSAEIFRMFDDLCVLAEGQVVYLGPAHQAEKYFTNIGYPFPRFVNPADYMMKLLFVPPKDTDSPDADNEIEEGGLKDATTDQVKTLIAEYKKSDMATSSQKIIDKAASSAGHAKLKQQGPQANIFVQLGLLIGRGFLNVGREPMLLRARIGQGMAMAILSGLIYLRIALTQAGAQDRISAIFFLVTSAAFGGFNAPLMIFPSERGVFMREYSANLYGAGVYYISKLVVEIPINTIIPFVTSTISYFMIGYNDNVISWLTFSVAILLLANVAFAMGMALSNVVFDTATATKVQPMILLPFMLFSGFFLNTESIPVYFIWLEYLSFLKYAFNIGAVGVFTSDLKFTCSTGEVCRYENGLDAKEALLGAKALPLWEASIILLGMVVGYHIISYIALYARAKKGK